MTYVKITDGVIVQKQPYPEDGFVEATDAVVCGMLFDGQEFTTPDTPEPVPLTKLYKSTFIRRLLASEATALEEVLNSEEAYLRLLYQSVEWFDVTDAMVMYLHMTLEAAFGTERANYLLAPEA